MTMQAARFIFFVILALGAAVLGADAQTVQTYVLRDSAGNTYTVKGFLCGTYFCATSVPSDFNGNPLTAPTNGTPTPQAFVQKPGSFLTAGTGQFGLAVSGVTQLTVPSGTVCALLTIEGAPVRRTSDGTSPSASNGSLIPQGSQWPDCGPLSSYKFYAVSGSPTIDAEYFK